MLLVSLIAHVSHGDFDRLDQLAVLNTAVTAWLSMQVGLDLLLCGT